MKDNFLSSGAYGCVYHPPYDCQGNPVNDKKYVSKVVKSNFSTKTEYNIGKILQKEGFITIVKKCDITRENLSKSNMRPNCKLLSKDPSLDKKYLLLYSKYIKSEELSDYLKHNNTILLIMKSYFLLCDRIDTLISTGIVHHDLHFGNVLYDNSQLYVIDFGLSLIKKMFYTNGQIDYDYLKKAVFKYSPSWNYWTLEYHFLCYLVHDGPLTKPVIEYTVNYYLSKNKVIQLLGREFITNYQKSAIQYFMKYDGISRDETVKDMLATCFTWDLFKIALHFIEIYIDTQMDIPSFFTLLLIMINPIPEFRPSQLEMKQFNQILLTTHTFENVKTNVSISKQLTKRLSSSASL
jgi:hypothetical protein